MSLIWLCKAVGSDDLAGSLYPYPLNLCFYPVPKVKSTVLVFEPIINKNFKVKNIDNLEKISHVFFSRKRKMVNKAFNELFLKPLEVAKKLNINLNLRPNELTENEYFKIAEYFESQL